MKKGKTSKKVEVGDANNKQEVADKYKVGNRFFSRTRRCEHRYLRIASWRMPCMPTTSRHDFPTIFPAVNAPALPVSSGKKIVSRFLSRPCPSRPAFTLSHRLTTTNLSKPLHNDYGPS